MRHNSEKTSALLEWGEPRDMLLAPRDGRQIMLLLSNGWMVLARYPTEYGKLPASDRWNVWWRTSGIGDVIDPMTIKDKPSGIWPVGWWNIPTENKAWEIAERLRDQA